MFQITFSKQSLSELAKLNKLEQIQLIEKIGSLKLSDIENPGQNMKVFNREGKSFYRLRAEDLRLYFTVLDSNLNVSCILQKDTWSDFAFRCKLPITEEQLIEKDPSFWSYLDNLSQK